MDPNLFFLETPPNVTDSLIPVLGQLGSRQRQVRPVALIATGAIQGGNSANLQRHGHAAAGTGFYIPVSLVQFRQGFMGVF